MKKITVRLDMNSTTTSQNCKPNLADIKELVRFPDLFRELYPDRWRDQGNCICPFHDDKQASFQATPDHGFCHAGCKPSGGKSKRWDIFNLWQTAKGVDFKTAVRDLGERAGIQTGKGRGAGKIVTTYDYQDETGMLVFQVVRYEPKDFQQRRPDGNGGWVWNLNGVQRVPYCLPACMAADEIWIAEGEKDADGLATIGLCGTTSPQGAGKWGHILVNGKPPECFEGKAVYILPDNDGPGWKHADEVARSLYGHAKSIRILDLREVWPEIEEKQDVSDFIEHCSTDEARKALLELAQTTPEYEPSEQTEIEADADSEGKEAKPSRFKILVHLLEQENIEHFHDQFQNAWACVRIGDHHENIRIKSGRFRTYLTKLFYGAKKDGCGRETLQQVQDLCSAKALFDGPQRTLSYRAAWQDGNILIDLGRPDWEAIEVTPEGWRIIQPKRPSFRRFSHMKPLPEPVSGGAVQDILQVLPIEDEISRTLICAWLPTILIPDIPRPGLILAGLQGSGKTFASERLRELVDPSEHLTQSLSKDAAELVQALDHNYLPSFDNLTSLPLWASDMLCRAVTGNGYSKRELYSDDDDVCYSFCRPFIMNGISVSASRPDLLDRVLICELGRISKEARKPLKRLMAEFRGLQPRVLGAMLDAISGGMRIKDSIGLDSLHRLADWQEWAVAVAEITGVGRDTFLAALETNISRQHSEVNTQDPTAVCVLEFMTERREWNGTPTDLYSELSQIAEKMRLDKEQAWPKAPNAFSRKLKAISHNLAAVGIEVKDLGRIGHVATRTILIRRAHETTEAPEELSASSASASHNDSNMVTADDPADDPDFRAVSKTGSDNIQECLPFDSADDADGISGCPAGPDLSDHM